MSDRRCCLIKENSFESSEPGGQKVHRITFIYSVFNGVTDARLCNMKLNVTLNSIYAIYLGLLIYDVKFNSDCLSECVTSVATGWQRWHLRQGRSNGPKGGGTQILWLAPSALA